MACNGFMSLPLHNHFQEEQFKVLYLVLKLSQTLVLKETERASTLCEEEKPLDLKCLSVLEGYFDLMQYRFDCAQGHQATKQSEESTRSMN